MLTDLVIIIIMSTDIKSINSTKTTYAINVIVRVVEITIIQKSRTDKFLFR